MTVTNYASVMRASSEPLEIHQNSLVGEDISTFSTREQAVYERAVEYGEMYWCVVDVTETTVTVKTDLGSPSDMVSLTVSRTAGTKIRDVCEALTAAVQALVG